jgi:hypothetical protein
MLGDCFSKSLISTCRTSVPLVLIGLADHEIVPDVAEPLADAAPLADEVPPPAGGLEVLLALLHPATPSAPTTPARAARCQYLSDLAHAMRTSGLRLVTCLTVSDRAVLERRK